MRRAIRRWWFGLADGAADALHAGVIRVAIVADDLLYLWRRDMPIRWTVHAIRRLGNTLVVTVYEKSLLEVSNAWKKARRPLARGRRM
ncbi:MAG TPA: hypothetical protein VFB07_07410 [Vicinamibacterales bacterium]|nr:hypothetical protein [Vicinamibacterales bacterium]